LDSEGEEPDRKLTQTSSSQDAHERRTVIGLNGQGKTVTLEETLQHLTDVFDPRPLQECDGQDLPAEGVTDRQRLTPVPVSSAPPTFEIHGPEIVRSMHLDPRPAIDAPHAHWRPPFTYPTEPQEDSGYRALARSIVAMRSPEYPSDFVRAPTPVSLSQLDDAHDDFLGSRERACVRPAALLGKARVPLRPETAQPLVAGLPRDSVFATKCGDVRSGCSSLFYELQLLTHGSLLFPRHR